MKEKVQMVVGVYTFTNTSNDMVFIKGPEFWRNGEIQKKTYIEALEFYNDLVATGGEEGDEEAPYVQNEWELV